MLGKLVTARTIEAVSEPSLGHIRVMTVRTLRLVLEAHGFRINRIIGTYGTAVYLPSMLRPIYVMLSRVLNVPSLAPNITVVIEKI